MSTKNVMRAMHGIASVNSLLAVGFFLIFVLALILGLLTAGLFGSVWHSAVTAAVIPIVPVKQICKGELPRQLRIPPKDKMATEVSIIVTMECQPKVEAGALERPKEPIAQPNTADTLSALSVVVALVTLALTLGSTHLAQKQRELEQLLGKERQRQLMEDLLTQAQVDVHEYFMGQQPSVAAQYAIDCGLRLRLLQSSDETQRKVMSEKLGNMLGPGNAAKIPRVVHYVAEVKRFLQANVLARGQHTNISFLDDFHT